MNNSDRKTAVQPNPVSPRPTDLHQAEALVLSCMDYRLTGAVADYMKSRDLNGQYDHVVLAGGALGAMAETNPAWGQTFWEHLSLARKLHDIRRVILIDHRDCGACKMFVGPDCADDPDAEASTHIRVMKDLADQITSREPSVAVEFVLMDLDGSVTEVT